MTKQEFRNGTSQSNELDESCTLLRSTGTCSSVKVLEGEETELHDTFSSLNWI